MMRSMRTTVDLPPAVHEQARRLADEQGRSLSAVVADLAVRGLAHLGEPVRIETSPITGLPVIRIGRPVTAAEVADLIDEDT